MTVSPAQDQRLSLGGADGCVPRSGAWGAWGLVIPVRYTRYERRGIAVGGGGRRGVPEAAPPSRSRGDQPIVLSNQFSCVIANIMSPESFSLPLKNAC